MATYSSILAWKISWTEEPGGLQSIGSQRVRHDRAHMQGVSLWFDQIMHFGQDAKEGILCHPCLENARDGGAWWAAVYGVAQSRTRLKRLSSSSSSSSQFFRRDTMLIILLLVMLN